MQKYRVVKTNVGGAFRNRLITECLFDNLSEDEANYALANLIDLGNIVVPLKSTIGLHQSSND